MDVLDKSSHDDCRTSHLPATAAEVSVHVTADRWMNQKFGAIFSGEDDVKVYLGERLWHDGRSRNGASLFAFVRVRSRSFEG